MTLKNYCDIDKICRLPSHENASSCKHAIKGNSMLGCLFVNDDRTCASSAAIREAVNEYSNGLEEQQKRGKQEEDAALFLRK